MYPVRGRIADIFEPFEVRGLRILHVLWAEQQRAVKTAGFPFYERTVPWDAYEGPEDLEGLPRVKSAWSDRGAYADALLASATVSAFSIGDDLADLVVSGLVGSARYLDPPHRTARIVVTERMPKYDDPDAPYASDAARSLVRFLEDLEPRYFITEAGAARIIRRRGGKRVRLPTSAAILGAS